MPLDKMTSNKDLLEACYRGDAVAIELFYNRFKDLVYSAINKWMAKYAREEDRVEGVKEVFQQAFLELIDNGFAKLRQTRDQDKPSALIFLIAQQCAGRYFTRRWKSRKRRGEIGDPAQEEGEETVEGLSPEEITALITEFLAAINDTERKLFELKFRDGLKYTAIAKRLGITTGNVGIMISRIRDKFRAFFKEKYPSSEDIL